MKKFIRFFTAFAVFLFIFTACGGKGNSGKQEISDNDPENQVSDGDEISDDEPEPDGTEEFVTVSPHREVVEEYPDEKVADDYADTEDESGEAEREIVESDIYKFDGNILWLVNQYKGLISVDISNPENLKIIGNLKFKGSVGEMYLQESMAYILVSYTNSSYEYDDIYYSDKTYSKLMVVNTEDPANLKLVSEFEIEGLITDSRQVGDVIYIASTEYSYHWSGCNDGGESGSDQISIMSVNVKDPQNIKMVDKVSVPGYGYTLYVSQKSLYVAEADTYYWNEDYKEGYPVTMFDISDPEGKIVKKAEFRTDGFMSDRWKMHEKDNVFYAVSYSSQWGNGDSMIESFDVSDPKNIKKLDKLVFMTNQQLYGTKFEGDRMYAVTYFQQDPLHVIDISDPAHLKQLGELEVPGWSDFIEVRGTKLLAVGRDNNKTKISMYDVANPENPKEINTVSPGYYNYSEANYDWKAFKIFDELGLILFPVTDYGDSLRHKLYLIDFDLDKGLKTRGYIASESEVRRGVAIQDLVFSIGDKDLITSDITDRDNPKTLSKLSFSNYVTYITRCGILLCGINDYSNFGVYDKKTGETVWKSTPLDKPSYNLRILKNSSAAYIFNREKYWWYDGDESNPNAPKVKIIKFDDSGKFEEKGDFPVKSQLHYSCNPAVSEKNIIVLPGRKDTFIDEDGHTIIHSEIMFFDMSNPKEGIKSSEVDFDYENLGSERSVFVTGDTFWTSGCRLKKEDPENGDQYYCYAIPFDTSDPTEPKKGNRINIPGELVGISENGDYLYTLTPKMKNYEGCYTGYGDPCWKDENLYDFYILKLNVEKTSANVVKKISLVDSNNSHDRIYEYVSNSVYIKKDKIFLVKTTITKNLKECSYRSRNTRDSEIKIVSVEDGGETYKKLLKDTNSDLDVQDGGVLLSTKQGWTYIAPDGREKSGNYESENLLSISDLDRAQLIDNTVYVSGNTDGIVVIDVK